MYAIICTGGKQFKVSKGEFVNVEKLDVEVGGQVTFDVLMLGGDGDTKIGAPIVAGAKVVAKVVEHGKGPKIIVYKYKAKKNVRKKQGHRQPYTKLEIVTVG